MKKRVVVKLFRFDKTSDHLSYYKPYEMKIDPAITVEEVLKNIKDMDKLVNFDMNNVDFVQVNSICVSKSYSLEKLFDELDEITIEPLATDYAVLDLEIDYSNYMNKLSLFENLIDESDKEFYKSVSHFYFMSEVRKANKDYMGEGIFLLAERLIAKFPKEEVEILKILANEDDGIWHYAAMCGKFDGIDSKLDEIVLSLKTKIYNYGFCNVINKNKEALIDKYQYSNENFFGENLAFKKLDTTKLDGLKVAVYLGNYSCIYRHLDIDKILTEKGIKVIPTNSKYNYSGIESIPVDPSIFDNFAGEIVADAIDCDADILITPWKEMAELMTSRRKNMECATGRELKINTIHTTTNLQ
ncbi:MAG: DUF5644 domain-containing protein [Campylobacterales bacterium]|nr:DUF5644 domain-containing protein [Campylobacterales bacterium]